jgi:hypothetical protein
MRSILLVLGSLVMTACVREASPAMCPCAASSAAITSARVEAKVPTAGTSPYGPGDDAFGASLGPSGESFQGNHYPGSHDGNRQNDGSIVTDTLSQ